MAGFPNKILPRGIQGRLFFLIAVVLVPMALLLGWTNFQRFLSLRDLRLQSETEVAQGIATAFDAYMSGHREHLHVTGQAILIFSPYSNEKATKVLREGAEHSPAIRNLSWVSPHGAILASTVPELVGRSLAARGYFQQVVAGRPWVISDLHPRGSVTDSPIFFIAVEARDEAGELRGVVVAAVGPEEIGRLTLSQDRPAAGRIALFDRQGIAVYVNPSLPLTWEERAQWRQTDRILQQAMATGDPQAGTTSLVTLSGDWVAARVPVASINWYAGAARPTAVAFAPVREAIFRDISLAVLITALAFMLGFFLAESIARPLLRLQLATRRMGEGEAVAIDDPHAAAEVQSLGATMKAMAANLVMAKKAAEEASRAKSVFLANMSHELRTPMTVIMGSLEFLQDSTSAPEKDQLLQLSTTSAQRLLGIIDDLLDISRIEAGRIRIEERPFALRECVRDAVEMFTSLGQEKGVQLSWQVGPQLPEHVLGDPDRISQVLINLVGNAVKFTDRGQVEVAVEGVDEQILFTVRDTGLGIPENKVEQIFQPFVQVDPSLTRRHPGSGLGLAISKELVALMDGTIGVKSRQGEGSTFTFGIPLRTAVVTEQRDVQTSAELGHRTVKILLVEDEPSVQELVTMTLHRKGMEVSIAGTGRQAVERSQKEKFDLILMDLQMPEMDGIEATRLIRGLERAGGERTCIFALTAHAREEDKELCMTAGMDGFLTKPLRLEKLLSMIEHCPCGLHSA